MEFVSTQNFGSEAEKSLSQLIKDLADIGPDDLFTEQRQ